MSNSDPNHEFTTIVCNHCGQQLTIPVYCGNRFCPTCSAPRAARVHKKLQFIIDNVKMKSGYRYKHLTLTIASQANIVDMVKHIVKSFRKLRQRVYWKNAVKGGAFVIEITGRPGAWHAHIHAVLETRWMDWGRLMKLWTAVSGGRGVYINNIPPSQAVHYLTKYFTKNDAPKQVIEECGKALSSFRLYQPFGNWHGIMKKYRRKPHPCSKCGKTSWYPERMMSADDIAYMTWLRADGIIKNYPVRASPSEVTRNNCRIDLTTEKLNRASPTT